MSNVVGEDHALLRNAIDVRRLVTHQAHRVGADDGLADIVAPDDQISGGDDQISGGDDQISGGDD